MKIHALDTLERWGFWVDRLAEIAVAYQITHQITHAEYRRYRDLYHRLWAAGC